MSILISAKGYFRPFQFPWFYEAWNEMRNINIWQVDKITFQQDKSDFNLLDNDTKTMVKYLLSSFAINELSIAESWASRASNFIKNEEILLALYEVIAQESVHAVAYNRLAEELNIQDELNNIYSGNPILQKRANFLKGTESFSESLAISTLFGEYGSLFVSFFLLGDLTRRTGKLSGLNDVNMYSIKDEVVLPYSHYKIGLELMKLLGITKKELKGNFLDQFLEIEDEFIMSIPGITDELKQELKKYLRWRVRHNSRDLSKCPETMIPFETLIRSSEHTNFFERKVTSYTTGCYDSTGIHDWLKE